MLRFLWRVAFAVFLVILALFVILQIANMRSVSQPRSLSVLSEADYEILESLAKKLLVARDNMDHFWNEELRELFVKLEVKAAKDEHRVDATTNSSNIEEDLLNVKLEGQDNLELLYKANPPPEGLFEHIFSLDDPHPLPDCSVQQPRNNFVYIKNHRTASETLASMFRRFAFMRELSIVLPHGAKTGLGWPYPLHEAFHRPSKTGSFNILLDHSKYTEKYLQKIMPPDSVYMTSIREPFSHLKSNVAFAWILQWSGINKSLANGMDVFLHNLEYYNELYKKRPPDNPYRTKASCIPYGFSMARNTIAGNLGFPVGFPPDGSGSDQSENVTFIREWVEHINQVFSVVFITDYFDESLIMLKRMMCWSVKDIMHKSIGITEEDEFRKEYKEELVTNFRHWSLVDTLVYKLFNQTLWRRIDKWGKEDFMHEVENYRLVKGTVLEYCLLVKTEQHKSRSVFINASKWNEQFEFMARDCKIMYQHLRDAVRDQYSETEPQGQYDNKDFQVPGC